MKENDIWEINSIGQLHRFLIMGRYDKRDCARKIFDQDKALKRVEDLLKKHGITGVTTIAVGKEVCLCEKDKIDALEDKLDLLKEYQKFGTLRDLQELRGKKENQNSKAIEVLEKVKEIILRERKESAFKFDPFNKGKDTAFYWLNEQINNQITELRGGENG